MCVVKYYDDEFINDSAHFIYESQKVTVTYTSYITVTLDGSEHPIIDVNFYLDNGQVGSDLDDYLELANWKNPFGFFKKLMIEINKYFESTKYKFITFEGSTPKRNSLYLKMIERRTSWNKFELSNAQHFEQDGNGWEPDDHPADMSRVFSI